MTNLVLVDTSVWIFALRKQYLPEIRDRVDYLLRENRVVTTGIVKLEILGGTRTENEFTRLKSRLDALGDLKIDSEVWESSCHMAFSLRRKGVTVPYTDILIAASAQQYGAVLLHADAHFDLISQHTELQVESYVDKISHLKG